MRRSSKVKGEDNQRPRVQSSRRRQDTPFIQNTAAYNILLYIVSQMALFDSMGYLEYLSLIVISGFSATVMIVMRNNYRLLSSLETIKGNSRLLDKERLCIESCCHDMNSVYYLCQVFLIREKLQAKPMVLE